MPVEDLQPSIQNVLSIKEFLEGGPPGSRAYVKDSLIEQANAHGRSYQFNLPVLELHCETTSCNGVRFFESDNVPRVAIGGLQGHFLSFQCRNCGESKKTYAVWSLWKSRDALGLIHKFGEYAPFGPPTPTRLVSLMGPEKDYYFKGRQAENQGLGIAAFSYYRRVVENQKNRIFDEIIRVSRRLNAREDMLRDLIAAKEETQFNKAVSVVKHGIPEALLVNGHNPLTLLHSALSKGMHAQTDEECLELATSIRVLLTDLVERLAHAFKDHEELNTAVSRLLKAKTPKTDEPSGGG